jgi:hypothetical protein
MVSFEPNRKGTLHAKLARKRHWLLGHYYLTVS